MQAMQVFQGQREGQAVAQETWSGKKNSFKNTVRDTLFRYLESATRSVNGLRGLPLRVIPDNQHIYNMPLFKPCSTHSRHSLSRGQSGPCIARIRGLS